MGKLLKRNDKILKDIPMKSYYLCHVHQHLRKEFPNLLSYTRFLGVMSSVLVPLCAYFTHCKGKPTGIAFVDVTSIKWCFTALVMCWKNSGITVGGVEGQCGINWRSLFKVHPEQVFLRYFWLFLWLHFGLEICKVIRLILPKTCKFNTHNSSIFPYKSICYDLFRSD